MAENTARRKLPGSLETNRKLSQWLDINADGTVNMRPGKIEIGQGILTALRQIVAEELDVNLNRVKVVTAVTAMSPNEGVTSGSRSIEESGSAFRYAAAEARELLLARAGAKLGATLEQLSVSDGVVCARGGASVTYWELTDASLLDREATGEARPKPPAQHKIVGTAAPRVDIPRKVAGLPVYVQDHEPSGMLHGRVSRPPSYSAELIGVKLDDVRAMPGVVAVVRDGRFLGVVAEREEQAIRAARRLAREAKWSEKPTLPEMNPRYLLDWPEKTEVISEKKGAAASAGREFSGEYTRQFLAHASIAPSCATAQYDDGKYTVWTHSQGIYPLRGELAPALQVPPEDIVVRHVEGAGCYGQNAADDVALDAALLARAAPGRAVRVQWMREDEFAWEPYSSAMVVKTRATLSDDGRISAWHLDVWSHGHSSRPGRADDGTNLLAALHLEKPLKRAPAANPPLPGGGSHRNAIPIYEFPNQRVTNHLVPDPPLRVSSLRGLGSQTNVFAIESFMDELAVAADVDPIEFRLRHLVDSRARAVVEKVATMANWKPKQQLAGNLGRGIGFARYKNLAGYMAIIAEVELAETLRVLRVWSAVDVGQTINPDGLINQMEGGIIQAVSFVLREEVKYDRERVTVRGWDDYPILSFAEVPQVVVGLINRPELPAVGAGEGQQGPVAAAVGNALFNASGVRLRDMPFTRERLLAAMAA
ncbi:MAG: xanthine dehydrogenase family protein molybdopterin-binding subunit [Betaproteobacteria bacterium]|nr:xanthine dehydrogenase family protein molybdopterin-binding subunit [Betaproteobacteria bacterium]